MYCHALQLQHHALHQAVQAALQRLADELVGAATMLGPAVLKNLSIGRTVGNQMQRYESIVNCASVN